MLGTSSVVESSFLCRCAAVLLSSSVADGIADGFGNCRVCYKRVIALKQSVKLLYANKVNDAVPPAFDLNLQGLTGERQHGLQ
jgi:hypothetical protein